MSPHRPSRSLTPAGGVPSTQVIVEGARASVSDGVPQPIKRDTSGRLEREVKAWATLLYAAAALVSGGIGGGAAGWYSRGDGPTRSELAQVQSQMAVVIVKIDALAQTTAALSVQVDAANRERIDDARRAADEATKRAEALQRQINDRGRR